MDASAPPFGDLLRRHRLAAGLSQEALAERSGLSARGVSDLERGVHRAPRRETIALLVAALGLAGPEQAALAAAVLRRRPLPPRLPDPADGPPQPSLVGRVREQAFLRQRMAAALDGRGGLVLIGGEAGIGKTALAEALCREARSQGALVLVGRCYDRSETPPYGLFLDLFRGYRPADGLPPAPFAEWRAAGAVGSQAALYEHILDYFRAAAARRPLAILFDDVHWADHASLDLLRVVARALPAWPVLAVATYRADELTRRHPLYALLPLLERESPLAHLSLRRLSRDAIAALVRARHPLPEADAARLVDYLDGRAEGNAFFVTQLLRALEERGSLRRDGRTWELGGLGDLGVPAPLMQVIDTRLARLDDATRDLLGVAAVVGQEAPLRLWAAAAGVGEDAVMAAAEAASATGLVEASADGARARFVHALVREAVYAGNFPPRRRRLHRLVAEALAAVPATDPDAVAYHFGQAGDARAIAWLGQAGERARRTYAYRVAADRLERALALADEAGLGDAAERIWLLVRLGLAYRFFDLERGLAHLEQAAAMAARAGGLALAAACRFHLGYTRVYGPDLRGGLAEMDAGIAALQRLASADAEQVMSMTEMTVAQATGALIIYRALLGRFDVALALAGDAAPDGLRSGAWFLGKMYAHAALGRPVEAAAEFARAAAIDRAGKAYRQLGIDCTACLTVVMLPYFATDDATVERIADQGAWAWERDHATEVHVQPSALGRLPALWLAGRWDELAAVGPDLDTSNTSFQALIVTVMGPFARARGQRDIAWRCVREILPRGPATEPGGTLFFVAQQMQRLAAALALDDGDLAAARLWLEAHDRWLDWSGAVLYRAEGATLWARYHRATGDAEQAVACAQRALSYASDPRQPVALLAAHRALGELAADAGRAADAEAHLLASLALAEACAAPYERALTLLALAEARVAARAASTSRALLDDAHALCARLGAGPTLARVDAIAARLPQASAPTTAVPAGLSAREVEVLRLVAVGQTNRAIASALFLSERTVQVHVRNILTKTRTENRTAAAAFARDHLLA